MSRNSRNKKYSYYNENSIVGKITRQMSLKRSLMNWKIDLKKSPYSTES